MSAQDLADRLEADAQRVMWHDEVLQNDDACRWGGVDTLSWATDMRAAAALLREQAEQLDTLRNELAQFTVDEPCNCGWGGVHDPDNLNCNRTQAVLAAAGAAPYPEEGATDE